MLLYSEGVHVVNFMRERIYRRTGFAYLESRAACLEGK